MTLQVASSTTWLIAVYNNSDGAVENRPALERLIAKRPAHANPETEEVARRVRALLQGQVGLYDPELRPLALRALNSIGVQHVETPPPGTGEPSPTGTLPTTSSFLSSLILSSPFRRALSEQ
jgi:hypothetical protein